MYESHYGLTAKPFSIVPNPAILFLSKNHENALTYLEYGFSEKAGFILLTGEIGAGKTTLVRHMMNKMGSQFEVAVIFNTNFSSDQLFRLILSEFEVECGKMEKEGYLDRLYRFLIDRYAAGRHVLLIIDEAQNLTDDALEDIRMLSNLQTDDQILLQIMLVGQPELKQRLNMPAFRQLAQRIAVNYHISPLDMEQTRRYIEYRIEKAGGQPTLFSPEAIEMVYRHSEGVPRTINLMCDTALVYGFADNLMRIDEKVVGKVIEDDICMTASGKNAEGKAVDDARSEGNSEADILKRIRSLEISLKKLKRQHDHFMQKVKSDLLTKYRELLVAEQSRYDRLLERYLQLSQTQRLPEAPDVDESGPEGAAAPPAIANPGTKFSHLMDVADAQEALDKEKLKISALLAKKDRKMR